MPRIRIKPQSLAEAKYKWERDKLWEENEELRAENARLKEEFESKLVLEKAILDVCIYLDNNPTTRERAAYNALNQSLTAAQRGEVEG